MRNGIVLIGVPGLAYNIFIGAIILAMMALHSWLERRHRGGGGDERRPDPHGADQQVLRQCHGADRRQPGGAARSQVLLGDNGAGKSTLIKILSGAITATSGEIFIRGRPVEIRSTIDAIANGIETIYQDSALVRSSIARNLFLGREPVKGGLPQPRWKAP